MHSKTIIFHFQENYSKYVGALTFLPEYNHNSSDLVEVRKPFSPGRPLVLWALLVVTLLA